MNDRQIVKKEKKQERYLSGKERKKERKKERNSSGKERKKERKKFIGLEVKMKNGKIKMGRGMNQKDHDRKRRR